MRESRRLWKTGEIRCDCDSDRHGLDHGTILPNNGSTRPLERIGTNMVIWCEVEWILVGEVMVKTRYMSLYEIRGEGLSMSDIDEGICLRFWVMISVAASFYCTPTAASSRVDTVERHDCSSISAVCMESP